MQQKEMADSKQSSQGTTINDDIWGEILKWVHAKTLGKCMCVCKQWCILIRSSYFIANHALHLSKRPNQFFLLREVRKPPNKPVQETIRICSDNPLESSPETCGKFLIPFKLSRGVYFRIVGAVDGIIFLSDDIFGYTYTFILWNPLVRKYIKLPKPLMTFAVTGPYIHALGFGYDYVSSDYKVVRIAYTQDGAGMDVTPPLTEVYSVRVGNWRRVDARGVNYCVCHDLWTQCFMRGSVHWVAFDRRKDDGGPTARGFKSNWLLLFDLVKEKFKRMKVPSELKKVNPLGLEVCEYHGLLAVKYSTLRRDFGESHCNLWVKKEYDVWSSWNKMFSINFDQGISCALYYLRNGDTLLGNSTGELLSYDRMTKTMESLEGDGIVGTYFACSFKESLLFLEKESRALSYVNHELSRFVPCDAGGSSSCSDGGRFTVRYQLSNNRAGVEEDTGGSDIDSDTDDDSTFAVTWSNAIMMRSNGAALQMLKFRHVF